jgi:hypothetical protein
MVSRDQLGALPRARSRRPSRWAPLARSAASCAVRGAQAHKPLRVISPARFT